MRKEFNFDAINKKIEQVLFSQKRFRIPRYQRPYAWGIEQISEFWSDLINNNEPYFIGSLVFCNENESDDGFVEIIDGQQRLLTITIFIAVLRDLAKTLDASIGDLYQRQDIAFEDRSGKQSFRIVPDEPLAGYFSKFIQTAKYDIFSSTPKTTEETRVKQNYEYLHENLQADLNRYDSVEAKLERLGKLRKRVAELIVIDVEISREEDAYEIFETTNARGVDLSVSDLLKNLIFKKIKPEKDKDVAKDVWQEITNYVQETNTELKKFIRYYWLSKHSLVTEKQLYREIRNKTTNWESLLIDLHECSKLYNDLLEGNEGSFQDYKHWEKIYDALVSLRLMEVSQCFVLLLSILRNYNKLGVDPSGIFDIIEKFSFQYSVVCNMPGNRPEKIYTKYAVQIEEECMNYSYKNHIEKIKSIYSNIERELKEETPSRIVYDEAFAELTYRNSEKNRKLIRYILSKIDSYYRKTKETRIDFTNVNIEHIMPQNPDKTWGLTKKQIRPYVNKLGNLTLVDKRLNSKAQNKTIKHKITELEQSSLAITSELVNLLKSSGGKWSELEILERHRNLGSIAYEQVWRI